MIVFVVASPKGGVGKSTLTTHLAVEAERAGDGPVVIVDADQQGSLAHWFNQRKAGGGPHFLDVTKNGLKQSLKDADRAGIAIAIIDTPGSLVEGLGSVIALADFVIIPVVPSGFDLVPAAESTSMVQEAGRPFVFVLNNAGTRAVLTGDASRALSDYGPVSKVVIYNRQAYRSAVIDGRTAPELAPNGLAAAEIAALWADVLARTKRTQRQEGVRYGKASNV